MDKNICNDITLLDLVKYHAYYLFTENTPGWLSQWRD